ncbi:MAG TPA: M20/M25/M40 family metallo-hydrolase [Pyrinomonadaceae bacterium]|nr:M20/M25/M40 family metallo-hydrolase [Pyrinomonadaceae bacterium]
MFRAKIIAGVFMSALLLPTFAVGQVVGPPRDEPIVMIKNEGMNRSQAMNTMRYLTDVIGARLTNSPNQRRANKWTKEQFEKWGLKNASVDPWGEFGRGWEMKRFNASVTTPTETIAFRAYPKAWSPSVTTTGDVVVVDAKTEEELAKYKGKLKGAIVLIAQESKIEPGFKPSATRNTDDDLAKMEAAKPAEPQAGGGRRGQPSPEQQFNQRKFRFYFEEGAAVLVDAGLGVDAGTMRVMGASPAPAPPAPDGAPQNPFGGLRVYSKGAPATIPQVVAEAEQYNRVLRLVRQGIPVKMSVDLQTQFYDDDLQGYNTIAEIPGTDLKDEVVMIGAHLDSWHSGTGATDNGAGSTVVMEAMRILAASGLKPRRTIRVALWTGEEQGLLGSRGYVKKNIAMLGDGSDSAAFSAMAGGQRPPLNKKPLYEKFAAYYNLDNGTGQIRGIYLQGNEQLRSTFKGWLEPFKEYGATTVTINNTGGTDHQAFDSIGLPGFQFIQDTIEYNSRTWHTTQDVSDRIIEDDLKKSAVIMATFAYNSAMTDEKLPRKAAPASGFASLFTDFNVQNELDELKFKESGMDFAICGHEIEGSEIPHGFPLFLTAEMKHSHAE